MDTIIIRLFLIVTLVLFLLGLIIPILIIKKNGNDPRGSTNGSSFLTKLTSISSIAWLIYIIFYLTLENYIFNFWAIEVLKCDFCIIVGIIIICMSFVIEFLGLKELGINFRIGFPKEETKLITSGIYQIMRNPIVFGIYLLLFGSFLVLPTLISIILFFANLITFNSKVIDEEEFLLIGFGEKYEEYKLKVGRYFPLKIKK